MTHNFYREMNRTVRSSYIFNLWEPQREIISGIIEKIMNENEGFSKIAILGAGNCNDIDMEYLSSKFKNISLFDIDGDAMREGLAKYSIDSECKIKIIEKIDFIGLSEIDFFSKLDTKLKHKESVKEISEFIRNLVNKLDNESLINKYKNEFDFIISTPVYTQLCHPLCEDILKKYKDNYSEENQKAIRDEFIYLANQCSKKYNSFIYEIGMENAKYFIISDVVEFTENNKEYLDIVENYIVKGDVKGLSESFTDSPYIITGAFTGLNDFQNRQGIEFQALNYWIWQFSYDKSYLVFSQRTKKVI